MSKSVPIESAEPIEDKSTATKDEPTTQPNAQTKTDKDIKAEIETNLADKALSDTEADQLFSGHKPMGRKTSFVQAIMVADSAIIDSVKYESSFEEDVTSNSKLSTASEQQIVKSEYEQFDDFDFDMDEFDV